MYTRHTSATSNWFEMSKKMNEQNNEIIDCSTHLAADNSL